MSEDKISITIGQLSVLCAPPSEEERTINIAAGQQALARAREAFIKKGINLPMAKGVPFFRANPSNPKLLIRTLDGEERQGVFVNGHFKEVV